MTPSSPVLMFLRRQVRRRRTDLLLAAFGGGVTAGATTLLLGLSGWFLAGAALAGAGGPVLVQAFNYLLPSAGLRGLAIARTAGRYAERYFGHRAAFRALAALRPALFAGIVSGPPDQALSLSSGEASARLVQDVNAIETMLVRRSAPWAAAASAGAAAGSIALASPWSSLVFLVGLAAQIVASHQLARRLTREPGRDGLRAVGRLKDGLNAYLGAAAELRCFSLTDRAVDALMAHDADLGDAHVRRNDAEAAMALVQAALGGLTLALVAGLSAQAPMPLIALAVLASLAGQEGVSGLIRGAQQAGVFEVAVKRLDGVISAAPDAGDPPNPKATLHLDGHVLSAAARVALTGPSGCGKTRTLEALLGLRAPPHGRFSVSETALEERPVGWARRLFAYAPQDARLLTGTIADNLRLGAPDADEPAMWDALRDACLDGRIRSLPHGLQTWIGDAGDHMSGGERKRLSLARAYLRPAPWLLLDEPTEGLDHATEAALVTALGERLDRSGQGLILVSHRAAPLTLCALQIDVSGCL
jgi:ATP-binding cassette subfamily C protein CydC